MKDSRGNEYDGWAIKKPNDLLWRNTFTLRRSDFGKALKGADDPRKRHWRNWYNRGYRCVKVRLVEVE